MRKAKTKMLSIILTMVLMAGNVIPAYSSVSGLNDNTKMETDNTETILQTQDSSEESLDASNENNIITGTSWWAEGNEKTEDIVLKGDGTITYGVRPTPDPNNELWGNAFVVEFYDENGYYFSTTSFGDAWYSGLPETTTSTFTKMDSTDISIVEGSGDEIIVEITRSGNNYTVTYTNIRTQAVYEMTAETDEMAESVNIHILAQYGRFIITEDYYNVNSAYETSMANYEAVIEHLNEYYIEKYPQMALELISGQPSDEEIFKQAVEDIISDSKEESELTAIYNWVNLNVEKSGYDRAMAAYNFRAADCSGHAELLCQLFRSAGIPSVVVYGYTDDFVNECTTDFMLHEKLTKESYRDKYQAWVLSYYNNQWVLCDSYLNRILYDKEEICRWYYTVCIEDLIVIYNDEYKAWVDCHSGAYFKDGQYHVMGDGTYTGWSGSGTDAYGYKDYYDLNEKKYLYTENQVIQEPGREGLVTFNDEVVYMKNNGALLCYAIRQLNDKLYYFSSAGQTTFDITDLQGKYRMVGYKINIDSGTDFKILPVIPDDSTEVSWTISSDNEDIIKVNEDGSLTATENSELYGQCCSINYCLEDGRRFTFYVYVEELDVELKLEEKINLSVGDYATINYSSNAGSEVKYIWTSGDSSIVETYNNNGEIMANNEGVAKVTATIMLGDGTTVSESCTIVVTSDDINVKQDIRDNDIYIIYENNIIDSEVNLEVDKIEESHKDYENIKPDEDVKFVAYDINLKDKNDNKVQPNGKLKVSIPCPYDFIGEKCKVYYISPDGKYIDMSAEYKGGFVTFETTHFSTYMITSDKLTVEEENKIIYGDINNDGNIDTQDAVLIKKYLAGYKGLDISLDACDVNADGDITSADAVLLLKHLAGYNVVLGQ